MADSAVISPAIAITPRDGRRHGSSLPTRWSGIVLISLVSESSLPYSKAESGSSGCFRSHSGRRLATTGSLAKLYTGGGDGVDHSSVHASHGSAPAVSPRKYECTMLYTKIRTAIPWINPPTETIWFSRVQPRSGSYV